MRSLLFPLLVFTLISSAQAQQPAQSATPANVTPVVGVPATFQNVVKAAIKLGTLDMTSDAAIDDFARIEYCDIYKNYHPNEFDWRHVRIALREKIKQDIAGYPDTLYLEREELVGQYDFKANMLLLLPDSVLHTRALLLAEVKGQTFCGDMLTIFPDRFVALLDKRLIFDGADLTEEEARTVVSGLDAAHNSGRKTAYGRYTIALTGTEPLRATGPAQLDATLQDVTLYLDAAYERPFWSGQSSAKSIQEKQGAGVLDAIPFKGIDPTTTQTKLDPLKPIPNIGPGAPKPALATTAPATTVPAK